MTARSCEEISKELEEMWSLRETWQTPEQQLLTDPKIDGLIERLKRTCGPTYEETFRRCSLGSRLEISRRSDPKSNLIHPNFCLN